MLLGPEFTPTYDTKIKIEDLKVIKKHDNYYLNVVYIVEYETHTTRLTLEGVNFPINPKMLEHKVETSGYPMYSPINFINIGFGMQRYDRLTEEIIETKTKEVTIEEIEEKFGCKVKIVKDKGDKK